MEEIYCFAGNPLDRASERRRDTAWIRSLLDDPAARILPLRDLRPLTRGSESPVLDWQPVAPWRDLIERGATLVFLGLDDERPYFAVDASGADSALFRRRASRSMPAPSRRCCPQARRRSSAEARSLVDWHARHRFCAQCGSPTRVASAGWVRRCPECKASHYPRSDPVTIMLAVRGERALLGRNRRRPGNRFSCLAGFMEPGETLEECVRREVHEESGVRVGRVRYLACQPWPFPSSLMMGFLCEGLTEEITVDPEELAEARWFDARGDPRHGRARRDGSRRPDPDLGAGAGGDRASALPALVLRARRRISPADGGGGTGRPRYRRERRDRALHRARADPRRVPGGDDGPRRRAPRAGPPDGGRALGRDLGRSGTCRFRQPRRGAPPRRAGPRDARPARSPRQQCRADLTAVSAVGGRLRADLCGQPPGAVPVDQSLARPAARLGARADRDGRLAGASRRAARSRGTRGTRGLEPAQGLWPLQAVQHPVHPRLGAAARRQRGGRGVPPPRGCRDRDRRPRAAASPGSAGASSSRFW